MVKNIDEFLENLKENIYVISDKEEIPKDQNSLFVAQKYRVKNAVPYFFKKNFENNALISEYERKIKLKLSEIQGNLEKHSKNKEVFDFFLVPKYNLAIPLDSEIKFFNEISKIPLVFYSWNEWASKNRNSKNNNSRLFIEVPNQEYKEKLNQVSQEQLKNIFKEKQEKHTKEIFENIANRFFGKVFKKYKIPLEVVFSVGDPVLHEHGFNAPKSFEEKISEDLTFSY